MALKSKPGREPMPPSRLERHHFQECRGLLMFTQADGTTVGFPLSWLYQFDYRKDERGETFVLHLTEHVVTVTGRTLGVLEDQLKKGEGFHVSEPAERYASIQRNEQAQIASITIEPLVKPMHENN